MTLDTQQNLTQLNNTEHYRLSCDSQYDVIIFLMEQHTLKNVNNCLNTNIYSYLETSGGQSSYQYLNVVHFFNTKSN
jgi:hypothetical protein